MDVRTRVIALLVTATAAASVAIGCGGDDDQKAGPDDARTNSQPAAQHHAQKRAQGEGQAGKAGESEKLGEPAEAEGIGKAGESDGHEVVNAADTKQIKDVVDQFWVFAGRGDHRGVCSLYSPAGRSKLGGSSGCRSFFKGALARQNEPSRIPISKIRFTEGGKEAIVEFEGFGRLMEMVQVEGKWFLEEVPGF